MKMDRGWCDSTLLFQIDAGQSDGVDLAKRTVLVAFEFPGPTLLDGNGTGRLHIDDGATSDQRNALEDIFQGKKGGPMEILGGLVSTWLPSESSTINIEDDGERCTATVEGFGEVQSQVLKNDAGEAMTLRNAGFAMALNFDDTTLQVAPSNTRWSDPALPREIETRSGARARWNWAA